MEDMHIHLKNGIKDINIIRKYLEKCKEKSITEVLFLDHGNRISEKHMPVLNTKENINAFKLNIENVKKEYPEIKINYGIETDFSYDKDFMKKEWELIEESKFDFIIGSVHGMDKLDFEIYLQANIDLINNHSINILGHLKLRKDYEKYKVQIEEIVRVAGNKNIKIEINTSDRSKWFLEQLQYMLGLFEKYKVAYTLGSDAHCFEDVGYNIKNTFEKINKIKNNEKRDIEFTIVSRGTEKKGSKGYMGITKHINNTRLLVLAKHGDRYIDTYKDCFEFSDTYTIENITVSRFELMSSLAIKPILSLIQDKILLIGFGNVGFTCLLFLLKSNYKNIYILTRNTKEYELNAITILNNQFNANIKIVEDYDSLYDTYIEATGSSEVIEKITTISGYNSKIILLGTPTEEKYFISPLIINRKNLKIFGGHELNGHEIDERRIEFEKILNSNIKNDFTKFVNIYRYENNLINTILKEKNNFFEVLKYDLFD